MALTFGPTVWILSVLTCSCTCEHPVEAESSAEPFPIPAPAKSFTESRELALRCARLRDYPPGWEKFDATDWHSDAADGTGLSYDDGGAHIAYWYAWLVLHDLHSGFMCTESEQLIRGHIDAIGRLKSGESGAISAMLNEAEELHSSMLSDAGQRFTKQHYDSYLDDYGVLFGKKYAAFSEEHFTKVRKMLDQKYGALLPEN